MEQKLKERCDSIRNKSAEPKKSSKVNMKSLNFPKVSKKKTKSQDINKISLDNKELKEKFAKKLITTHNESFFRPKVLPKKPNHRDQRFFSLYTKDYELVQDGYVPVFIRAIKNPVQNLSSMRRNTSKSPLDISPEIMASPSNKSDMSNHKIIGKKFTPQEIKSLKPKLKYLKSKDKRKLSWTHSPNDVDSTKKKKKRINATQGCSEQDKSFIKYVGSTLEVKIKDCQTAPKRFHNKSANSEIKKPNRYSMRKSSLEKNCNSIVKKAMKFKEMVPSFKRITLNNYHMYAIEKIEENDEDLKPTTYANVFWENFNKEASLFANDKDEDLESFLKKKSK